MQVSCEEIKKSYKIENLSRTCNLCKIKIQGGLTEMLAHGRDKHSDYYLSKSVQTRWLKKVFYCPLNEKWYSTYRQLSIALTTLGITRQDYHIQYGEKYLSSIWIKNQDPVLGNSRNEPYCKKCGKHTSFDKYENCFPAFCSFSCSTQWYANNTDRVQRAMDTLKQRQKENPNHRLCPNQKKYWINKGFSEDESINKVKERQAVGSLANFINRAGGDIQIGTEKWKTRQIKWINTLDKKSKDEKLRINRAKASSVPSNSVSLIGLKLFTLLEQNGIIGGKFNNKEDNNEVLLEISNKFYRPDFLYQNKIIEFFGNYWHFNPISYTENQTIMRFGKSVSVKEVWMKDAERIKILTDAGYKIKIVWEQDFKINQDIVVEECLKFLQE